MANFVWVPDPAFAPGAPEAASEAIVAEPPPCSDLEGSGTESRGTSNPSTMDGLDPARFTKLCGPVSSRRKSAVA